MILARLLDKDLQETLTDLRVQKIPAKAAFVLKGIQKRIEEELVKYEEVRKELLLRYGKKNEDGTLAMDDNNSVLFAEEGRNDFIKEYNDLVNTHIDVGTLSISLLGDRVELSGDQMMHLDGILVE